MEKISDLLQKLNSVEQESTSSSKNFLRYAFGEEGAPENTVLAGKMRIVIIDWVFLISASLLINRETAHLAVHYLDAYLKTVGQVSQGLHILAAASLLLSVKQEERERQADLIETICLS